MRRRLPETQMCKTPGCRAWSWELGAGKPCPYCHKIDWVELAWSTFTYVAVGFSLAVLAGLAGLAYLSGVF
jgi:hypothetical protein